MFSTGSPKKPRTSPPVLKPDRKRPATPERATLVPRGTRPDSPKILSPPSKRQASPPPPTRSHPQIIQSYTRGVKRVITTGEATTKTTAKTVTKTVATSSGGSQETQTTTTTKANTNQSIQQVLCLFVFVCHNLCFFQFLLFGMSKRKCYLCHWPFVLRTLSTSVRFRCWLQTSLTPSDLHLWTHLRECQPSTAYMRTLSAHREPKG